MRFFATAAKGTEPALRDELRELRLRGVRADRGGVHFEGEMPEAARACLWSRIAVRVLVEVSAFDAPDEDALYEGVRDLDWTRWMTARTTLAVRATCRSSRLTHSQFVAQRTKDAVVDLLRDRLGARPSVDRDDPDVLLAVHLARDRATVYLDAGGASLHERGWRREAGDAPLRETLAAAVLRLSGWDREQPLVDPMCGAGTIAIEAAAWATRAAPGLSRERFGFERWADHDGAAVRGMQEMRASARAQQRTGGPRVVASDASPQAVRHATANAKAAGVAIEVSRHDVRDLAPLGPAGFVVTNPPYGARLEAGEALYAVLARSLGGMHGHTAAILAGTPAIARAMRREADRWWALYNGPIECRLLVYAIR
ncbi:MAG TPA: THUMP domain-containing protein [Polyangiaceae bacterium]